MTPDSTGQGNYDKEEVVYGSPIQTSGEFSSQQLKFQDAIKEVSSLKDKIVEILAVFVALFTFVAVEFQIFRSFSSWSAGASLTFILLGSLLIFTVSVEVIFKSTLSKSAGLILFLACILLSVGIFFFSLAKHDSSYLISDSEKELMQRNFDFQLRLNDLEKNIENIKIRNPYLN